MYPLRWCGDHTEHCTGEPVEAGVLGLGHGEAGQGLGKTKDLDKLDEDLAMETMFLRVMCSEQGKQNN